MNDGTKRTTTQSTTHTINGCKPINALEMTTYSAKEQENGESTPKNRLWQPGQSGNPAGRPKGTRNKLSEQFLEDMHDLWKRRGMQVLESIVETHPEKLLAAMVQVLPRDFQVTVTDENATKWVINAAPLSTEEWQAEHGLEKPTDESNHEPQT